MRLRLRGLWLTLGYLLAAAILFLSLYPFAPIETLPRWTDKVEHGMTHLILAGWFLQIYHGKRQWILVSIACLAFGGAIELLQMLTPARAAEWLDLGADAVGVGLASGIAFSRGKYLLEAVENRLLNSNWKTA